MTKSSCQSALFASKFVDKDGKVGRTAMSNLRPNRGKRPVEDRGQNGKRTKKQNEPQQISRPFRSFLEVSVGGGLAGDQSTPLPARKQRQNLSKRRFDSEPIPGTERVNLAVFDEAIGPANAHNGHRHAHVIERFDHR